MEDVSAAAGKASTPVTVTPRIVAAVNAKEARWFLSPSEGTPSCAGELTVLDLSAERGAAATAELQALNPEVLVTCWSTPFLPEKWLESRECRLRYICHLTGSVRHVVSRRFIERGGLVSNWGSIPAPAVAEHAILLALAALRNLPAWPRVLTQPHLAMNRMETLQVKTMAGRRVGIHGFGQVARALVRLLAPFDVTVCAYSAGVPEEIFARAGVREEKNLRALFAGSDLVFECEALNPQTQGSVQSAELAAMPAGAVLINVARAGLIDEEALYREATAGRIRLALDVFAEEPLPPDSRWLQVPGVILSPHIAGPTFDQYAACTRVALENIARYCRGQPLKFVVTPEVYDRST